MTGESKELMETLAQIYIIVLAPMMVYGLVSYLLCVAGYYAVAKRRGIEKPWLAWIPVGNSWILGSISDHYQLQTHYCTKNKRKVLLWLQIILIILLILMLIFAAATVLETIEAARPENQRYPFIDFWKPVRDSIRDMVLLWAVIAVVAPVLTIVQYVALYDLYRSCNPESSGLYMVLSILLPVTLPVLVFTVRKRDLGMRGQ